MKLDKTSNAIIKEVARRNNVEYKRLKELYLQITQSNFYMDLCDIVRKNEEELKGE